jgi:inorganic triphosphatase YgiF
MADRGKAEDYLSLVNEAEDRASSAIDRATDISGLDIASEAVLKHLDVLENVLNRVPDEAKAAISAAICRSSKGIEVLADLRAGEIPFGGARTTLDEIKSWTERLKTEARENIREGIPVADVIQNLELEVARDLTEKIGTVAADMLDKYTDVVKVAQERHDSALKHADDDEGLLTAEEAVLKHLAVLERVYENVPEQAKAAICLAISKSTRQVMVIAEVKAGKLQLGEQLRKMVEEVEIHMKEFEEEVEENLKMGYPAVEIVVKVEAEIIVDLSEKLEELAEDIEDNALALMLQSRVNDLVRMVDSERALEKAIEVSQKAVATLENVLGLVPEVAREHIKLAKVAVQKHVEILENSLTRYRGGLVTDIGEAIEETFERIHRETPENYEAWFGEVVEKELKETVEEIRRMLT